LDVVIHAFLEGDDRSGIDLQRFAWSQGPFQEVAAAVNEHSAWPSELFEDESLAAEESGAETFHHGDIELRRGLRDDEAVALHENALAGFQIEGLDAAGKTAREADFAGDRGAEVGQK